MSLGRRGYVIDDVGVLDKKVAAEIRNDLTVAPVVEGGGYGPQRPKKHRYYMILDKTGSRMAVPRFYAAASKIPLFQKPPRHDFGVVENCSENLAFCGSLKTDLRQPEAVDATLAAMRATGGAMLSLAPGQGKTVCALSIACTLGLKTLIVVHKEFLMNQWIERVGQFVPTARVGRLQQGTVEVGDRDVVVAMIHSIALRAYPPQVFDGFGLTIVDESHHVSAPVFSQAMFAANSPYVLGLTATPERKDGLQRVLHWFLGDIAFQTVRTARADVVVDAVRFDLELPPEGPPVQRRTGKVCMPTLITMLTENAVRNELILGIVRKHAAAGRKIIVLSDRRTHCDLLHRRLGAEHPSGLYVGGMSESDLNASATRAIVLATYAMATEGLDIPALDTLVLATPKSDVVQASGRILRECVGKVNDPLIVDVVDAFGMFYAQFNKRRKFYVASGFEIRQGGNNSGNRVPETPRRAIEGYGFVADDD